MRERNSNGTTTTAHPNSKTIQPLDIILYPSTFDDVGRIVKLALGLKESNQILWVAIGRLPSHRMHYEVSPCFVTRERFLSSEYATTKME